MEKDEDNNDEDTNQGFCHFHNDCDTAYSITLFGQNIILKQAPADVTLGHGAVIWEAAVVFCKYMENNPQSYNTTLLKGKTVLELGSGCGLAGIGMMLKGAIVTMTDLPRVIMEMTMSNAQNAYKSFNSMGSIGLTLYQPVVLPLDWTQSECFPLSQQTFDILLLTDCVFSSDLVPYLIQTILKYSNPKSEIICCHEIRDEVANLDFVLQLKKVCHVKKVNSLKLHPDYNSNQIEILIAKLKRGR